MKKLIFAALLLLSGCARTYDVACFDSRTAVYETKECDEQRIASNEDRMDRLKSDSGTPWWVYMLAIGAANSGSQYPAGGGTGQSYIHTPNAYGPDIHSDQYGRPVRVVPGY